MPRELSNQASYEGWRNLSGDEPLYFEAFHDWADRVHPFEPVSEDFMTFVLGPTRPTDGVVPTLRYTKVVSDRSKARSWHSLPEALSHLSVKRQVAGQVRPGKTAFTIADSRLELDRFALIAGECPYVGREGIEFYPQELLLLQFKRHDPSPGMVVMENVQRQKSKYRIPKRQITLETKYLFPLVRGPELRPFGHAWEGNVVPFPYAASSPLRPIDRVRLRVESPFLLRYLQRNADVINDQTAFSDKIRGVDPGEFYGVARTGPYSFQRVYVAFRDNTKWCAAVVTERALPWGASKRCLFQNHAASICERLTGEFITEEEAHFLCAILNAPVVEQFIYASSDSRSFNIRVPIWTPLFDARESRHRRLASLSRRAHDGDTELVDIRHEINEIYLSLCRERTDRSPGVGMSKAKSMRTRGRTKSGPDDRM